jgi:hypothetical protein
LRATEKSEIGCVRPSLGQLSYEAPPEGRGKAVIESLAVSEILKLLSCNRAHTCPPVGMAYGLCHLNDKLAAE